MRLDIEDVKSELKRRIDDLTVENMSIKHKEIVELIYSFEGLRRHGLLEGVPDNEHKNDKKVENIPPPDEEEYIFKRKMLGGELLGKSDYHISEGMVRSLGLESGDLVSLDEKGLITVLQETKKYIEDRFVTHKFCDIKEEAGVLYCDRSLYGGEQKITVDGKPYKFILNDFVINKFKLKAGDLVDIVAENGKSTDFKVQWVHKDGVEYIKPLKSGYYKDKVSDGGIKAFGGIDFGNRDILVMGCEPRKAIFKEAIEGYGGKFSFMSGEEQSERIESAISNADVLLLMKDFLSHVAVFESIKYAKKYDTPVKVVDGLGIKTLVLDTNKLIETAKV